LKFVQNVFLYGIYLRKILSKELRGNEDKVRFIKKQKNGLARTRDADGWRENA
jgi:hypothetical protein